MILFHKKLFIQYWKKSRLLSFTRKRIQLWQHSENLVTTIMSVVHYHPRLKNIVAKFKTKGSVLNHHKGASGRPKECRTVENIEAIRLSVFEDHKKSYRKRTCSGITHEADISVNNTEKGFNFFFRLNAILYSCSVMPTKQQD